MVPEKGARVGDRHLQRWIEPWPDYRSTYGAVDCRALRLAHGLRRHRRVRFSLVAALAPGLSPARRTSASLPRRAGLYQERSFGADHQDFLVEPASAPANMGLCDRKVPDRSDLVVLSLLAGEISRQELWHQPFQTESARYRRLRDRR